MVNKIPIISSLYFEDGICIISNNYNEEMKKKIL